jgi:hypothetical protein
MSNKKKNSKTVGAGDEQVKLHEKCEHCDGKLVSLFDAQDGIHQGCKGKAAGGTTRPEYKFVFTPPAPVPTTGGTKHDQGKVPVELLPTQALEEIAKVLDFGKRKYHAWNWSGGFAWSRLIGAAMRHLFAWQRGENKDPESGLSHLAHLGCCVLFLIQHELSGLGEDDRFTGFVEQKPATAPGQCWNCDEPLDPNQSTALFIGGHEFCASCYMSPDGD